MDLAQVNRKSGMTKFTIGKKIKSEVVKRELTVPLIAGNRSLCIDARVEVNGKWASDAMKSIIHTYGNARSSKAQIVFGDCVDYCKGNFVALAYASMMNGLASIDCIVDLFYESDLIDKKWLPMYLEMKASERILHLVKMLSGSVYYCGKKKDRPYLDEKLFTDAGIDVESQEFLPPPDGNLSWLHEVTMRGESGLRHAIDNGIVESEHIKKPTWI